MLGVSLLPNNGQGEALPPPALGKQNDKPGRLHWVGGKHGTEISVPASSDHEESQSTEMGVPPHTGATEALGTGADGQPHTTVLPLPTVQPLGCAWAGCCLGSLAKSRNANAGRYICKIGDIKRGPNPCSWALCGAADGGPCGSLGTHMAYAQGLGLGFVALKPLSVAWSRHPALGRTHLGSWGHRVDFCGRKRTVCRKCHRISSRSHRDM